MHKLLRTGLFAAAVLGFALAAGASAREDKVPSIKEIMGKAHKGPKSIGGGLDKLAKSSKWEDVQSGSKTLKEYGEAMGKNKPPKGDDASWKKQSETYKKNTAALADAAEAKDSAKFGDALKKLNASCKDCHTAHKK